MAAHIRNVHKREEPLVADGDVEISSKRLRTENEKMIWLTDLVVALKEAGQDGAKTMADEL